MDSRPLPHDQSMGRFVEVVRRVVRAPFLVDRALLAREQLSKREQLRLHAHPMEGLHVGDRDRRLVGPQVSLEVLDRLSRRPVLREHDGADAVVHDAEDLLDLVDAEVVAVVGGFEVVQQSRRRLVVLDRVVVVLPELEEIGDFDGQPNLCVWLFNCV